jgi:hypothetical protein
MFTLCSKATQLVVLALTLAQFGASQLGSDPTKRTQDSIAASSFNDTKGTNDTSSLEPLSRPLNHTHDDEDGPGLRPILRARTRCRFVKQKGDQIRFHLFMEDFGLDGETWCDRMDIFIGLNCWDDNTGGKRQWGGKMRSEPWRNAFELMRCKADGEDTLTGEKGHMATFELHKDGKCECEQDRQKKCKVCKCPKGSCKKKGQKDALARCVEDAIVKAMPGLKVDWLGEGDHCYKVDRDVNLPF